jgi:hypothetical protein
MRGDQWRKLTNDRDNKPEKNSDAAFGTSLRIRQCFHRSKQNLCIFFNRPTKKFKNHWRL